MVRDVNHMEIGDIFVFTIQLSCFGMMTVNAMQSCCLRPAMRCEKQHRQPDRLHSLARLSGDVHVSRTRHGFRSLFHRRLLYPASKSTFFMNLLQFLHFVHTYPFTFSTQFARRESMDDFDFSNITTRPQPQRAPPRSFATREGNWDVCQSVHSWNIHLFSRLDASSASATLPTSELELDQHAPPRPPSPSPAAQDFGVAAPTEGSAMLPGQLGDDPFAGLWDEVWGVWEDPFGTSIPQLAEPAPPVSYQPTPTPLLDEWYALPSQPDQGTSTQIAPASRNPYRQDSFTPSFPLPEDIAPLNLFSAPPSQPAAPQYVQPQLSQQFHTAPTHPGQYQFQSPSSNEPHRPEAASKELERHDFMRAVAQVKAKKTAETAANKVTKPPHTKRGNPPKPTIK